MIILPEEAVYKKVDTGREGERVYLMEIAGNRRFFYWMQDKDADKDEVSWMLLASASTQPVSLPVGMSCIMSLASALSSPAGMPVGVLNIVGLSLRWPQP